jgi:sphinganine-1-phosphate aldolase
MDQMELELVRTFTCLVVDTDKSATSGGTESILMSVKTHRDWARKTKGITEPEM